MPDSATPAPFRFGVQISRMRSRAEWIAAGQRAEHLGYDVFLMPDHFGPQMGIMPALATIAAHTSTIHLGTLVWQNDLRHPALLMKDIATLDVLSEGRFEIGIGAGGSYPPDFQWTGIPFDPPNVRVSRLEECIRVLKGLAADEPFSHAGDYYQFDAYEAWPKPFQRPMPPLLIAAGGRRMLRLAAREADIVGLLPAVTAAGTFGDDIGFDAFVEKAVFVREIAGDRAGSLEFNILVQQVVITEDAEAEIARLMAEREMTDRAWFDSPMVYVGTVEEIAVKLRRVREEVGASYFVVFEPAMEDFARVMAFLRHEEA
ncbi:MAG: TIGR03621 family F420-dependent LLM class oxidoreductase [Thermomicrobiales bacterium]